MVDRENKCPILQSYYDDDLEEILRLFYEAIHNAQDYSQTQLDAWEPLAMQPVKIATFSTVL